MRLADQLPRIFQANMARFNERVIAPSLAKLAVNDALITGSAPDMDAFLDRCASQVDNYTANEANRVFALVLVSLFERQVRLWAGHLLNSTSTNQVRTGSFIKLVKTLAEEIEIDLDSKDLGTTIEEAFEVGNVVRHGDGRALESLRELAPHLIDRSRRDYVDLLPPRSPDSEWLRIRAVDVERYNSAIIRFWGLADRLPGAVTEVAFSSPKLT